MTIINRTYKFIFVHIPKNAGTTATKILSTYTYWSDLELGGTKFGESLAPIYANRFGIGKHTRAETIRNILGEQVWDRSFKFALVRDPFARTFSIFRFLRQWKDWPNSHIMNDFTTFESFVTSKFFLESSGPDGMFNPQFTWVTNMNGNIVLNHVGKVENMSDSFRILNEASNLSISINKIERINESGAADEHQAAYTDAARAVVMKRYQRDFVLFGYKTSPS